MVQDTIAVFSKYAFRPLQYEAQRTRLGFSIGKKEEPDP